MSDAEYIGADGKTHELLTDILAELKAIHTILGDAFAIQTATAYDDRDFPEEFSAKLNERLAAGLNRIIEEKP